MLLDEKLLTLTEGTKVVPPVEGQRPHISTLWRWARKGLRGVKLETVRIGHRIVTSEEALDRFFIALAELPPDGRPRGRKPSKRRQSTEAQRRRDVERAERELREAGV